MNAWISKHIIPTAYTSILILEYVDILKGSCWLVERKYVHLKGESMETCFSEVQESLIPVSEIERQNLNQIANEILDRISKKR